MVINAPRMFATGWDSFQTHYDLVGPSFDHGQTLRGVKAALQMVVLALPAIGFAYTAVRVAARGGTGAWHWSHGSVVRRAGVILAGAAVVGAIAYTWWPNGDYRPIQPGERGTLTGGLKQLGNVTSGRAALTPERQRQLHGAPTQRQVKHRAASANKPAPPPTKDRVKGKSKTVSQKPAATTGGDQAPQDQTTTPDTTTSPQPDPNAAAPEPAPTTTDPSAPPPDQTSTQPDQQPPPQDGGSQTTPPPTTP
jgi:putative peptide zinc metalloprotease protein